MCVYLRAKFAVSSIILTSYSRGEGGIILQPPPPPTSKLTTKKPNQIKVNSMANCIHECHQKFELGVEA